VRAVYVGVIFIIELFQTASPTARARWPRSESVFSQGRPERSKRDWTNWIQQGIFGRKKAVCVDGVCEQILVFTLERRIWWWSTTSCARMTSPWSKDSSWSLTWPLWEWCTLCTWLRPPLKKWLWQRRQVLNFVFYTEDEYYIFFVGRLPLAAGIVPNHKHSVLGADVFQRSQNFCEW